MNKTELDDALAFLQNPEGELQIIIYAVIKDETDPVKLDIDEDDLPAMKELFTNSITKSIIEESEHVVLQLSSADERGKCFYQYDLEIPEELEVLENVVGNDKIENFNFRNDELAKIESLIVVLADNTNDLTLYKKLSPVEIIGRGGYIFRKPSERFERFEEQLLRITPKFQVIRVGGELIIMDLGTIERSFGFHDVIEREALVSLNAIRDLELVSNIEALRELVSDVSFARKLTKVARSSPVMRLGIPNESIIAFSKNHPSTKRSMRYNADETKFNLDTRVSKDLLIKMLNDDLLTSELTKLYYDSIAKDGVEIESEESSQATEIE